MLTWLRKLWPFHWPWKPEDVPEPTNPILLIPGICGTQLAVRNKGEEQKDVASRVWVCIEHAVRFPACFPFAHGPWQPAPCLRPGANYLFTKPINCAETSMNIS